MPSADALRLLGPGRRLAPVTGSGSDRKTTGVWTGREAATGAAPAGRAGSVPGGAKAVSISPRDAGRSSTGHAASVGGGLFGAAETLPRLREGEAGGMP